MSEQLIDQLIDLLIYWLIDLLIDLSIDLLFDWLNSLYFIILLFCLVTNVLVRPY